MSFFRRPLLGIAASPVVLGLTVMGLAVIGAGCGTKEDVSLSVYAQDLTLTRGTNAFGDKLEGSVTVVFDLGHYSGAPVHVENITLTLVRGDGVLIGGRARFVPDVGEATLPFDVAPGQKKSIRYAVHGNSASEPLALNPAETKEVCSGPVAVSGSVQQQGKAEPIRIGANPVSVQSCP